MLYLFITGLFVFFSMALLVEIVLYTKSYKESRRISKEWDEILDELKDPELIAFYNELKSTKSK